jgi:hypothetical protein
MSKQAFYPCSKCSGTGRLPHHANVLSGVCFQCAGSGRQLTRPATPSIMWAVYDARGQHFFNVRAKTAASAIKQALVVFHADDGKELRAERQAFKATHDVSEVTARPLFE